MILKYKRGDLALVDRIVAVRNDAKIYLVENGPLNTSISIMERSGYKVYLPDNASNDLDVRIVTDISVLHMFPEYEGETL